MFYKFLKLELVQYLIGIYKSKYHVLTTESTRFLLFTGFSNYFH